MRNLRLAILATLALLLVVFITPVMAKKPQTIDVQILAINDFHGNLEGPAGTIRTGPTTTVPAGGIEYLAHQINTLRATNPNTIVVSAGDLIGASPLISALFHDEPTIEAFNLIGLELNGVGNHEFDEGTAELLRMQTGGCHPVDGCQDGDGFAGAKFKFLAANVFQTRKDKRATTLFPSYQIRRFPGEVKVGFIGVVLKGTPTIVTPSGVAGLEFRDEADTINALIPQLKAAGVETIVVLLHEGGFQSGLYNECRNLSGPVVDIVNRTSKDVDLFITGHTHQGYNCVVDGRVVTSAASFGRLVTDIDLTIDRKTRNPISIKANNVIVERNVTLPPQIKLITDLVNKYKNLATPLANRIIGNITADITRAATLAGESALGDVIADAQLNATASPGFGNAVIAFMNPGGIRADLLYANSPAGEALGAITYGEAFAVQPFGNSLVTMTLTGAQIETLLEQQFVGCPNNQPFNRILQVSQGFSYTWNQSGPACNKIDPANIRLNGYTIDPNGTYRVTVNSFLASGGDNFVVLNQGTNRLGGEIDLDALEAYFKKMGTIAPGPRNRIAVNP